VLRIEEVEQRLVGLPVLAVTSDPRSGSLFELGEWVRLPHPVVNPNLTERLQNYRGSESIFVRCRWELDSPVDLIPVGTELRGFEQRSRLLEALVGGRVTSAKLSLESLELVLVFDNEMKLKLFLAKPVFCSQTLEFFGQNSLRLGFRNPYWTVSPNGEIKEKPRMR
jgi:hypothetical protein